MATRITPNVSVSPERDRFLGERMAAGHPQSVSEAIRDGLRLLEERELAREAALKELRAKIGVGMDQIKTGQVRDGEQVFAELGQRSRRRRGGARA